MRVKIAVLSDTHYCQGDEPVHPDRRSDVADVLLLRAVHRINRMIRPDVTLVLGDLINDGDGPRAEEELRALRDALGHLRSPCLVIPGNHDGDPEAFFRVFGPPPEWRDVGGVRFVPFVDPEEPGFNARREPRDLERMARARAGFKGPIVAFQHTPLFPPGASDCPYNYTNADAVIAAMRDAGIRLAIGGHYHPGMDLVRTDHADFVVSPALCESPFSFLEATYDGETAEVVRRSLRMPEDLELVDRHVHTPFAYCNENMDIPKTIRLARLFGLAGLGFSEHSDQLYFDRQAEASGAYLETGIHNARPEDFRAEAYFNALAEAGCPPCCAGLELDSDFAGNAIVLPQDQARAGFRIGAIHSLREFKNPQPDPARARDEFLRILGRFLSSGIEILAHPFRVFRRGGMDAPPSLFDPVVRMLREAKIAAEINFHTNEPPPEFFELCIEAGVPISLGTDAHNLYEVGELAPHLELLRACGCDGNLKDVLLPPGELRRCLG
ncbi:MAG TPA: metallophosphoesterase [Sumerlaeia bacterium]|nr:metallophosphoesterase [Sumerlaeia bacterium]